MSHSERRHEAEWLDSQVEFDSDAKALKRMHDEGIAKLQRDTDNFTGNTKARKLLEEQAAMYRAIR